MSFKEKLQDVVEIFFNKMLDDAIAEATDNIVTVTVLNSNNEPVSGAKVYLIVPSGLGEEVGSGEIRVDTGNDGIATFNNVPYGEDWGIIVEVPDGMDNVYEMYEGMDEPITISRQNKDFIIVLEDRSITSGTVTIILLDADDDSPITDAEIYLTKGLHSETQYNGVSPNNNGIATIPNVIFDNEEDNALNIIATNYERYNDIETDNYFIINASHNEFTIKLNKVNS